MHRRAVISLASGTLAGVAGCLSATESDGEANGDSSVAALVDSASENLSDATDTFSSEADKFERVDDGVDFRTAVIFGYLDQADDSLATAAERDDGTRTELIRTLQHYSSWLRSSTRTLDHLATTLNQLQQATNYVESERYDDAIDSVPEAEDALSDTESEVAVAQSELDRLEANSLSESEEIDYIAAQDEFRQLHRDVDAIGLFIEGYLNVLRGLRAFVEATASFESENYSDAASRYAEARTNFANAETVLQDGEETAPANLQSGFIELTCLSAAHKEASDHYNTASKAAENGEYERSRDEIDSAEAALNRCE
jgi:hypothetical protein